MTFSYAGLSLAVPERVRYRYRLDGFDRGWSRDVTARQAVYTNLPPGSYTFRVMASNSDGVWNSAPATVTHLRRADVLADALVPRRRRALDRRRQD